MDIIDKFAELSDDFSKIVEELEFCSLGNYAICVDCTGLDFLTVGKTYAFSVVDETFIKILENGEYYDVFSERFEIVSKRDT